MPQYGGCLAAAQANAGADIVLAQCDSETHKLCSPLPAVAQYRSVVVHHHPPK